MQENDIFADAEIIDMHSSADAVNDGFLIKTEDIHPEMQKSFFSHITTNLLNQGYFAPKDSERKDIGPMNLIIPNMVELLTEAQNIIVKASNGGRPTDSFFSGQIELPTGESNEIFIAQNETGRFTIMLAEDY